MSDTPVEVLCVGDLMLELFVRVDMPSKSRVALIDYPPGELGGSARNVSHYLAGLGRDVDIVAVVPPTYREWCAAQLSRSRLSNRSLHWSGDFLDYLMVCDEARPFLGVYLREELNSRECRKLVRSQNGRRGKVLALLGSRRHSVRLLSMLLARRGDFDCVLFAPSYAVMDYPASDLIATLRLADILILNESEAEHVQQRVTDLESVLGSARSKRRDRTAVAGRGISPISITTLAGAGAKLSMNRCTWQVPSFSGTRADVIGAGDAFAAGFIDAWLDSCTPIEAMFRGGCTAAVMIGRRQIRASVSRIDLEDDRFQTARRPLGGVRSFGS